MTNDRVALVTEIEQHIARRDGTFSIDFLQRLLAELRPSVEPTATDVPRYDLVHEGPRERHV